MSETVLDPPKTEDNPQTDAASETNESAQSTQPVSLIDYFSNEVKQDPAFEKFKPSIESGKADEIFKSYRQAEKALGSRVKIPDEKSTPEEVKAFYQKLGKPTDPKDYAVELDPFFGVDEAGLQEFQRIFDANNLTKTQAEGILQALNGAAQIHNQEASKLSDKVMEETTKELKQSWGANFDMNKALAKRAVGAVFGETKMESIISKNGNDKDFIEGMYKVGRMLNEKGLLGKASPRELGGYGPEEALAAKNAIVNDKNNAEHEAYWNKKHPQHKQVVDKVLSLIQAAQVTG